MWLASKTKLDDPSFLTYAHDNVSIGIIIPTLKRLGEPDMDKNSVAQKTIVSRRALIDGQRTKEHRNGDAPSSAS